MNNTHGPATFTGSAISPSPVALKGRADFRPDNSLDQTWVEVDKDLQARGHLTVHQTAKLETFVFGYLADKHKLAQKVGLQRCHLGSDAEAVAQLYEQFNTDFLGELSGNWALAIIDRSRRTVILARDQAGTRPLFYSKNSDTVQFATAVDPLIPNDNPVDNQSLNLGAVSEHLSGGFISNRATLHTNVKPVPPAHLVELSPDAVSTRRYWSPGDVKERPNINRSKAASELRLLLKSVIAEVFDVHPKIGCHLTGGLDSTAIIAFGTQATAPRSTPAYAWQPPPTSGGLSEIDSSMVHLASQAFTVVPSYLPASTQDMEEFLAIDPVTAPATSTLMAELPVMRRAHEQEVTLIVSGWGGDDFVSLRAPQLRRGIGARLARLRRRVTRRDPPKTSRERMIDRLDRGHLAERTDSWSIHGARFGVQYTYPLLDRRLIEFALSLPNNVFVDRGLMREALTGVVPEQIRLNTDKSDTWRSRHTWDLLESARETGIGLPVIPDRIPLIDNTMFARYLSQSRLQIDSANADASSFLAALQLVYDPDGQPYSDCAPINPETITPVIEPEPVDIGARAKAPILLQATLAVVIADLAVRFVRFSRIASTLGEPQAPGTTSPPAQTSVATAVQIGDAVDRVSRRLPHRPLCLPQAIATQHLLRRRGIRATLKLGVKINPPSSADSMAAHSWVAVGNTVVNGQRDYRHYTVTNTFTSDPR